MSEAAPWKGLDTTRPPHFIGYDQAERMVAALMDRAAAWNPDAVVAIVRGGLVPATMAAAMLALPLALAGWDRQGGKVSVACLEAAPVVHLDGLAISGPDARERNDAWRRGQDRGAEGRNEVEAAVAGGASGEGIEADPEAAGRTAPGGGLRCGRIAGGPGPGLRR